MSSNAYHFITHWRAQASLQDVNTVLGDATSLPRWWPSVYLSVRELAPGDAASGVGRVLDLHTKGWLPYTLRWQLTATHSAYPHGFVVTAHGDFVGRGAWSFRQDGDWVDITYDWRIEAQKPLLRRLSGVLKPLFAANHEWAMRMGEKSLQLELRRRRAQTAAERAAVPPPPGPTFARRVRSLVGDAQTTA